MCERERVCVSVCASSLHMGSAVAPCRMLAGCPPCISAACVAGSWRCSPSDHTYASLSALYCSLSCTSAHTLCWTGSLLSPLSHCRDKRETGAGLENAAKRGAFVAEVCVLGFILAHFSAFLFSSNCVYVGVCACARV